MGKRIALSLLFLSASWLLPWWAWGALGLLCLIFYKNFWEFPAAAFAGDLLYGAATPHLFGFTFAMTALALIFFFGRRMLARELFMEKPF